jgi:uncharacterized protein (TIGR03437 family)
MIRGSLILLAGSGIAFATVPLVTFPVSLPTTIIRAVAVDTAGNVYATGTTYRDFDGQNRFPATPGAFQTVYGSRQCTPPQLVSGPSCLDAFVAKFSPAGQLVYATYLGGSGNDEGFAIAVDSTGNAWVTGYTISNDFPVTPNALQPKNAGGFYPTPPLSLPPFEGDAFVAGLNASGSALIYSSFLGGSKAEAAYSLAMDPQGNLYLAGQTYSSDFPTTTGPPPSVRIPSGFVAKFNPTGPAIIYSTHFEAPIEAMAVDSAGSAYAAGSVTSLYGFTTTPGAFQTTFVGSESAFVTKLKPDGSGPVYSTLLNGQDSYGHGLAVDGTGSAWVVGAAAGFPVTVPPATSGGAGLVARLSPDGSALVFSANIGFSATTVLLDAAGNAYVAGGADSSTFTRTPDALENTACGISSSFITKWSPEGALLYSSISREGKAMAIDSSDNLYLVQPFATLFRYDPNADQRPSALGCMTNGASFTFLGVVPGEIVSLFGDRLGPVQPAFGVPDVSGKVGTTLANTRVFFDGVAAPILYADQYQINAIAPWELTPGKNTAVTVQSAGVSSPVVTVPVVPADPGIFRLQFSPAPGQGAVLNQDGSVNSPDNPAAIGSIVSIFGTGMGLLNPVPQDGEIISDASHLLQLPIQLAFNFVAADIMYAGAAPTLPAGVIQINTWVPDVCKPMAGCLVLTKTNGLYSSPLATVAVK